MSQYTREQAREAAKDTETAARYLRRAANRFSDLGDQSAAKKANSTADNAEELASETHKKLSKDAG